jgi:hypothetical protein
MFSDLPGSIPATDAPARRLSDDIVAKLGDRTMRLTDLAYELGVSAGAEEFASALESLEAQRRFQRLGWRRRRVKLR